MCACKSVCFSYTSLCLHPIEMQLIQVYAKSLITVIFLSLRKFSTLKICACNLNHIAIKFMHIHKTHLVRIIFALSMFSSQLPNRRDFMSAPKLFIKLFFIKQMPTGNVKISSSSSSSSQNAYRIVK